MLKLCRHCKEWFDTINKNKKICTECKKKKRLARNKKTGSRKKSKRKFDVSLMNSQYVNVNPSVEKYIK